MSDDSPMPCAKPVTEPEEAAHYRLDCALEAGHDGPCHAHLYGESGRCTCGAEPEGSQVGQTFVAQAYPPRCPECGSPGERTPRNDDGEAWVCSSERCFAIWGGDSRMTYHHTSDEVEALSRALDAPRPATNEGNRLFVEEMAKVTFVPPDDPRFVPAYRPRPIAPGITEADCDFVDTRPRIDVAIGVIVRDDRVLLVQRLPHKEFGFMWECPGGKVEPGEMPGEALIRELREEVGLQRHYAGYGPIAKMDFDPPIVKRACRLHYFRLTVFDGFEPECNEGIGYGWFTRDEAMRLTLAPGNRKLHQLWKLE